MKAINVAYELIVEGRLYEADEPNVPGHKKPRNTAPKEPKEPAPETQSANKEYFPFWTPFLPTEGGKWQEDEKVLIRNLFRFIRDEADPPSNRYGRRPGSPAYKYAQRLDVASRYMASDQWMQMCVDDRRFQQGRLLNRALKLMVAEAETLEDARRLFVELQLVGIVACVDICIADDEWEDLSEGWDDEAYGWDADLVWNSA